MQRYFALAGLSLALAMAAPAQESSGTHVVVPARDPARPRVVKTSTLNAPITVKTHAGTDVIVEAEDGQPATHRHSSARRESVPEGMHRIDLPPELSVTEDGDVIQIQAPLLGQALTITVPVETSLELKSLRGPISVEGVHGEVDATCVNGSIELAAISGTIVADTTNGSIRAAMDRVDPSKPISFSSVNGSVDVTLPADLKANFKLRTLNGSISTDFDLRLAGGQNLTRRGGMSGTVNGGGVEASFSTLNGRIAIHRK